MRAAVLFLVGCGAVTEVRVTVDNKGVTGLETLRIRVTNPELTPEPIYDSQPLPLCVGRADKCFGFPVSLTLVPGERDAKVRVEVDALGAGDSLLLSQASIFKFVTGVRQKLGFILYDQCQGRLCAADDLACNQNGECQGLRPTGAPPKDIRRVHKLAGDTNGDETFTIPPSPMVQPGDVVILLIGATGVTAADGWQARLLSNGGTSYNLLYRVAGEGEASDVAGYTFVSHTPGQLLNWVMAVYRGASDVRRLQEGLSTPPYEFDPVVVPYDGLVVDMLGTSPDQGVCNLDPVPQGSFDFAGWYFWEIAQRATPSSTLRTVTCGASNPAALFSLLLY